MLLCYCLGNLDVVIAYLLDCGLVVTVCLVVLFWWLRLLLFIMLVIWLVFLCVA